MSTIEPMAQAQLLELTQRAAVAAEASHELVFAPEDTDPRTSWGWWRFLSSLAKTEGLEDLAMDGVDEGFCQRGLDLPWLRDYVASHRADEHRHGEMLKAYLKTSYGDRPAYRSFSNVFIYGIGFRVLKALNRRDPLHVFVVLMLYEKASMEFYRQAIALAEAQGKPNLVTLLSAIRQDESRHLAGATCVIQMLKAQHPVRGLRKWGVRLWTRLILWDLSYGQLALHNGGLRKAFKQIGFDRPAFAKRMHEAQRHIKTLVSN